jgi:hypothetical protein
LNTLQFIEVYFRIWVKALRIMTPLTRHGTTFEEDRSPDPWTVIDRKTLNVCNAAFFQARVFPQHLFLL